MPTRNEAFGLVYQEAAAAGLPAIGTRLNAVPEIIEDGTDGTAGADRGTPRRSVPALGALADSAELRERLGRAARRNNRAQRGPRRTSPAAGRDPDHAGSGGITEVIQ